MRAHPLVRATSTASSSGPVGQASTVHMVFGWMALILLLHVSQTLDIATIGTAIVKWGVQKYLDRSMLSPS
jgi:hypothetical protein